VEISFASRKLQKVCESEKELRKSYGSDGAPGGDGENADIVNQ